MSRVPSLAVGAAAALAASSPTLAAGTLARAAAGAYGDPATAIHALQDAGDRSDPGYGGTQTAAGAVTAAMPGGAGGDDGTGDPAGCS